MTWVAGQYYDFLIGSNFFQKEGYTELVKVKRLYRVFIVGILERKREGHRALKEYWTEAYHAM